MTYSIYEKDCLVENVESPVSFIFGKETNLLPIVENSLHGKEAGSEISIEVSPELGFGKIDKNLIFIDELKNVPSEYRKVGLEIDFANEKGIKKKFRVSKIDGDKITFDGNHLFAGKSLVYKIKITDVKEAEAVKNE